MKRQSLRFRWRAGLAFAALVGAVTTAAAQQARVGSVKEAWPTGDPRSSVLLIERDAPSDVRVGADFEYTLTLTNLTNMTLGNLSVTEQPGEGLEIRAVGPEGFRQAGSAFTWDVPQLEARGRRAMRVRAVANRTGDVTNCCNVTFATRSCGSIRVVQPELVIEKTMPPEVMICDPIPVRIVVKNPGSGTAEGVMIRDSLPDGWTTDSGQKGIEYTVGSLGPGQAKEFTFRAKASATGSFRNCAMVEGGGGLTAQACAETRVTQPKLELAKTGPTDRYLNRPGTFDITVRNTGDAIARDVVISDVMPAGLRAVRATEGGRVSGNALVWSIGALEPGASRTVQVEFVAEQAGQFRNVATAKGYCCEATAEAPLSVRGIPAVLLEVVDENDPDEIGTDEKYTITVTNQGSATGTNIRIICEVQPEAEFVNASSDRGQTASVSGKTVTFTPLPELGARQQARFFVTVKGQVEADTRFKVTMYTNETGDRPIEETESTRFY